MPNFLDGFGRLVAFDAETTGNQSQRFMPVDGGASPRVAQPTKRRHHGRARKAASKQDPVF
jgi:hypothetical protein